MLMALQWNSNRTDGRAATRWWSPATYAYGTYHIEADPTRRKIYYVFYVGPNGSGEPCQTKLGSAYTVKAAKELATRQRLARLMKTAQCPGCGQRFPRDEMICIERGGYGDLDDHCEPCADAIWRKQRATNYPHIMERGR